MTAALNITFGELAEDSKHMYTLKQMMIEVQTLAEKFNVTLTEKDIEDSLAMVSKFPYQAKTSFQLDFENNNQNTEKENLLDYVITNGEEHNVSVEKYREMNKKIANR